MRAAFFVLLATAAGARAEPGFVWQAPESCPDGAGMRSRIERRLGSPLEVHGIEVAITRDGSAFVAHVDTRGVTVANQIRTLKSARCDELADAVAVIVARLATEWRRASTREALRLEAARVAIEDARDAPTGIAERASPAPPTYGYGVHAMALSGVGMVPRVGVGGELSVFGRRENLFAEVGYARWARQSAYLVAGAPGRVEVGLEMATVRAGWSPMHMPLRAWVGGELGAMRGEGFALEDPQGGSAPWFAVTSGFGVGWPMSRYARLVGTFEVAIPTSRVGFRLAEGGDIYRSSSAAARCALGLEVGLP